MAKSIETIWKEGFLDKGDLIVPKLNDLYNQKSMHLVDKYQRMFKRNIALLFWGSFILVALSFLVRIPVMGVLLFFIFQFMVHVDKLLMRKLNCIDKSADSYSYLINLKNWMIEKTRTNMKVARFTYPYLLLALLLGFWFMKIDGEFLGNTVVNKLLELFPSMYLVWNVPFWGLILLMGCLAVLYLMGGKLYLWDMKVVYGGVMKKLDELIDDMQQLRE